MIDTLIASCRLPLVRLGSEWAEERKLLASGEWETKYHRNSALAQMTHRGTDLNGKFTVQASLPNILFGQNVTLLSDTQVKESLDKLYAHIAASAPEVEFPPMSAWNLQRVDWCYVWKVSSVQAHMDVVDRILIGSRRHVTVSYEDRQRGGKTKSVQTKNYWSAHAYDKEAETRTKIAQGKIDWDRCAMSPQELDEAARGVLRFEYRVLSKQLQKILGPGNVTVAALEKEIKTNGLHWIAEKWNELTANWKSTSYEDALRLLRSKNAEKVAGDLMDFWMHLSAVGEIRYRQSCPISNSTWQRRRRKLVEAGVACGLVDGLERPVIPVLGQQCWAEAGLAA